MNDNFGEKVNILKKSNLFIDPSDNSRNIHKQSILLVLTGQKPLAEVTTSRRVREGNRSYSVPEDHQKIADFLEGLGLYYYIYDTDNDYAAPSTNVAVSTDASLIERYKNLSGSTDTGEIFGYPKTSIEAFGDDKLMMSIADQEELEKQAGLPDVMPSFRFSKKHYKEEIGLMKSWHDTLKRYDLLN